MTTSRLRVLLVTAPYHSGVVEAAGVWLPLALVYVAGAAREAGAEVRIYDAMSLFTTHEDIAKVIEDWKPDVVGTTAITATEPDSRVICETAKRWNPAVKTIVGNVHATFCWDRDPPRRPERGLRGARRGRADDRRAGARARRRRERRGPGEDRRARLAEGRRPGHERPARAPRRSRRPRAGVGPRRLAALLVPAAARGAARHRLLRAGLQPALLVLLAAEVLGPDLARPRSAARSSPSSSTSATPTASAWRCSPTRRRPRAASAGRRSSTCSIERKTGVELLMETRVDDVLRDEDILPKYVAAGV